MHRIQQKILKLAESQNLANLTLRKIGALIREPGSPQKIKHHFNKLMEKGLLIKSIDGKKIEKISKGFDKKTNLISLPIYGSANCGEALELADNHIQDYLKVSPKILGPELKKRIKNLYVLKAKGDSMNRAQINSKPINNGDYVIIDKTEKLAKDNQYVVSLIDGAANIKKILIDKNKKQIVLISESTLDIAPIFIHQDDLKDYCICGTVVEVMNQPNELDAWAKTSAQDILKDLGPISKQEVEYYKNL
jgi:SOS-response transcriptional repressor LexA